MTAAPPRRAAAVLFALLLVATGGALFVTQRLKRSSPIVERVYFYEWVSPNGDGRKDTVKVRFDLPKAHEQVSAWIVDGRGQVVRTLVEDAFLTEGTHPFRWNGRDDGGQVVPDGRYRLRVGLREEGRSVTAPRILHVDTTPPKPRIVAVTPPTIVPGAADVRGRARIHFKGPTHPAARIAVWRTDDGPPRQVAGFSAHRGRETATWDGLVNGLPAPEGAYAFSVTVQDIAGNQGSVPPRLPPRRRGAVPRSGVEVAYFTLSGPVLPVEAGGLARFTVGPTARPTRWRLTPYGGGRTLNTGISHGRSFAVRIPRDADADVYSLVATTSDGRRAAWPVVVGGAGGLAPVLVVVPMVTWQGQNAVDSDRDGWTDTLETGDDVPLDRGFLHGRPPPSVADETVALLAYLAHIRANFDLTTDVALAAGKEPRIAGHNGVLLAGTERWLTSQMALQLRRLVRGGGTVASFGAGALRRYVALEHGMLVDPTGRRRRDIFGERSTIVETPEAPVVVSQDKLGLFQDSDGFIGSFTQLERSDALDPSAALLTAAGRSDDPTADVEKPAFVAYTLGKGIVIRTGTDQWTSELEPGQEAADATRRMWTLLSR